MDKDMDKAAGGDTPRFVLTALLWLRAEGMEALNAFRTRAGGLFTRHDLRIEREVRVTGKGQVVGENLFERPDVIQVLSFASPEGFKAYLSDPEYIALAAARDASITRMTVCAGRPVALDGIVTPGIGAEAARLYGVGLVRFNEGGAAGFDAFNRQAQAVFARHGVHVEAMIDIDKVLTPIGVPNGMNPERIVIFFLDDPAAFAAYVTDPDYLRLAPLRDDGLVAYDVFTGFVDVQVPA